MASLIEAAKVSKWEEEVEFGADEEEDEEDETSVITNNNLLEFVLKKHKKNLRGLIRSTPEYLKKRKVRMVLCLSALCNAGLLTKSKHTRWHKYELTDKGRNYNESDIFEYNVKETLEIVVPEIKAENYLDFSHLLKVTFEEKEKQKRGREHRKEVEVLDLSGIQEDMMIYDKKKKKNKSIISVDVVHDINEDIVEDIIEDNVIFEDEILEDDIQVIESDEMDVDVEVEVEVGYEEDRDPGSNNVESDVEKKERIKVDMRTNFEKTKSRRDLYDQTVILPTNERRAVKRPRSFEGYVINPKRLIKNADSKIDNATRIEKILNSASPAGNMKIGDNVLFFVYGALGARLTLKSLQVRTVRTECTNYVYVCINMFVYLCLYGGM